MLHCKMDRLPEHERMIMKRENNCLTKWQLWGKSRSYNKTRNADGIIQDPGNLDHHFICRSVH